MKKKRNDPELLNLMADADASAGRKKNEGWEKRFGGCWGRGQDALARNLKKTFRREGETGGKRTERKSQSLEENSLKIRKLSKKNRYQRGWRGWERGGGGGTRKKAFPKTCVFRTFHLRKRKVYQLVMHGDLLLWGKRQKKAGIWGGEKPLSNPRRKRWLEGTRLVEQSRSAPV